MASLGARMIPLVQGRKEAHKVLENLAAVFVRQLPIGSLLEHPTGFFYDLVGEAPAMAHWLIRTAVVPIRWNRPRHWDACLLR